MGKLVKIEHVLWTFLFSIQLLFVGFILLTLYLYTSANSVTQPISEKVAPAVGLERLRSENIELGKEQQQYLVTYCIGLERTITSHTELEKNLFLRIKNAYVLFVGLLVFSIFLQIGIFVAHRKIRLAGSASQLKTE